MPEDNATIRFSAVIPSYKRQWNIARIVSRLSMHTEDIVICDNNPGNPLTLPWNRIKGVPENLRDIGWTTSMGVRFDIEVYQNIGRTKLRIIRPNCNTYTFGRFVAATICDNDAILTCDDDYLVGNWGKIKSAFTENPGCVSFAVPERILKQYPEGRWCWKTPKGFAQLAYFGWGSAFDRRMIHDVYRQYVKKFKVDHLLMYKADRILSIGMGGWHNPMLAKYEPLNDDEPMALYRRPDHATSVAAAHGRALELLGGGTGEDVKPCSKS